MKHLKTYNLFESKFETFIEQYKKIQPILSDILLPLTDSDIKYQILLIDHNNHHDFFYSNVGGVTILIDDKVEEYGDDGLTVFEKFFTWKQIKEEILHAISFMNSEDINFSKLEGTYFYNRIISGESNNVEIYDERELEELGDDFKFTKIEITFSKLP